MRFNLLPRSHSCFLSICHFCTPPAGHVDESQKYPECNHFPLPSFSSRPPSLLACPYSSPDHSSPIHLVFPKHKITSLPCLKAHRGLHRLKIQTSEGIHESLGLQPCRPLSLHAPRATSCLLCSSPTSFLSAPWIVHLPARNVLPPDAPFSFLRFRPQSPSSDHPYFQGFYYLK